MKTHNARNSIEIEGKYIVLSYRDIPQYNQIIKYVFNVFDIPKYDGCVIFLHNPIPWTRVETEYRNRYPGRKFIIYNFEQLIEGNPYFNIWDYIGVLHVFDEVWSYTSMSTEKLWTCRKLMEQGKKAKFVPIIANPSWDGLVTRGPFDWDIGFVCSLTKHRLDHLKRFTNEIGFDYTFNLATGIENENYYKYLSKVKMMLLIHGGKEVDQEIERLSFLVYSGIPVLSESSVPNYFEGLIEEYKDPDTVRKKLDKLLEDPYNTENKEKLTKISNNLREMILNDVEIPTENFKYINYL